MTDPETLLHRLAVHPFLAGLEPRLIGVLAGMARFTEHRSGTWVARQGRPAEEFHLIEEGRYAIEITAADRPPLVIATVHPGDVLGWSWLVAPYHWHFDVVALDRGRTIVVDAASLRAACSADHEFGFEITRRFAEVIAMRLEATELQLIDVYGHHR